MQLYHRNVSSLTCIFVIFFIRGSNSRNNWDIQENFEATLGHAGSLFDSEQVEIWHNIYSVNFVANGNFLLPLCWIWCRVQNAHFSPG